MATGLETILGAVTALIVVSIVLWIIIIYNGLVMLKNNIQKAWANIDVLLKQRSSEVPNLVSIVKGYMKYEKEVFTRITEARAATTQATSIQEKARANGMMTQALKSLFAVAENYPKLKAGENFLKLQKRITELENMIADRREFFNDSVTAYNIRIQQIPDTFIARFLKYEKETLFEAMEEEKKVVKTVF
ncbi:LemA family protein [Candidatus Micrarchaeota archaeon]|nr:LemA family protein [Candidatus Micrarchaeota archaeon]